MSAAVNPAVQAMMPLAVLLVRHHQQINSPTHRRKKGMKPVNGFMAFRAYHEGLFPGVEQKEKSHYLTFLWHQEKDLVRWTVLAMGFTIVRDVAMTLDTAKPKMKEFLDINASFLGLPLPPQAIGIEEAQRYLTNINGCAGIILVEDIIANSLVAGLLPGILPGPVVNQPAAAVAAPVAAPTHNVSNGILDNPGVMELAARLNIYSLDLIEREVNRLTEPVIAKISESLMYQGGTDDQVEFSENSEVQTDFNPLAGDPWTTYDISASCKNMQSSLMRR